MAPAVSPQVMDCATVPCCSEAVISSQVAEVYPGGAKLVSPFSYARAATFSAEFSAGWPELSNRSPP